jgi:hypothetical protein
LRLFRKNCELTLGKGQQKWLIKQSVTEWKTKQNL